MADHMLTPILLITCVGLSMFHLTTSAPTSSDNDEGDSGKYEGSLKALAELLAKLEKQRKTKSEPSQAQDQPRAHQVIFSKEGPNTYISRHKEMIHPIEEKTKSSPSGDKRVIQEKTKLWDDGKIPYTFSSDISEPNKVQIRKMMDHIERSTCLRWEYVEQTSEEYHVIIVDGDGCYSEIGNVQSPMSETGNQTISLQKDGCMHNDTILHELCHTVGLEHEHSRPDRDKYITINLENLPGGENNPNYQEKDDVKTYGKPFDISSVMMYNPYSMGKQQGSKTYDSKDPILEPLALEDHQALSFYDKFIINKAYECAGDCDPKDCQHDGFLSEGCECICPDGLTGDHCESVIQEGDCNNEDNIVIEAIGETVTVTSPDYPDSYPTGSKCRWLIEGPKGSKLRATMLWMDIRSAGSDDDTYCLHSLELRYNILGQLGPEMCGNNEGRVATYEAADYPRANTMLMTLDTKNTVSSDGYRGFKFNFTAIPGNDDTKAADVCKDILCKNGGTCRNKDNNFWCECDPGFRGRYCDHEKDQTDQSDLNTVFLCDKTLTGECEQFDLEKWETTDNGRFIPKPEQQGSVKLQIPYTITRLNEQYCLHFRMDRPNSQKTCSELTFLIKREMDMYGFQITFDDHLFSDRNCAERSDVTSSIGFTSDLPIKELAFKLQTIPTEGANIELSDFRLEKAACP